MENEDNILADLVANCTNATTNSSCGYPYPEDADDDYFYFILFKVVVPITYGLVSFIGFIGNLLVIYVILSKHKMRTVTNILLLNLALADLSFVLIVPPFTAYYWAVNVWEFGTVLCKAMQYLLNVTAYVTVYTLVLISIIRYLTIVYSAQTMRFRTKQNMVIMNILIWVVMLAVNIPIILSYLVAPDEYGTLQCIAQGPKEMYANFFAWAYLLPLTIIAIFSICILRHIRKAKPTMLNKKTKSDDRKKQAARVIILVVVIFGISWLPIHIHLLVNYFYYVPTSKFYTAVSVFWNALAYTNSCVNPIIYNYASKDFRDSFREVIHCIPRDSRGRSMGAETTVMTRATLNSTPNGGEMKNLVPKENGEQEKLMDTADV